MKKKKELSYSEMIISKIKKKKKLRSRAEISSFLSISPNTLSTYMYRDTINVRNIISLCQDFDLNWLLRTDSQYNEYKAKFEQIEVRNDDLQQRKTADPSNSDNNLYKKRIAELESQVDTLILQNASLTRILEESFSQKIEKEI